MNKRKYNPPLELDMDFDEALERFAQTNPIELGPEDDEKVRLVQREGDDTTFLIYESDHGVRVELRFNGEPWFTQLQLAQIFGVDLSVVNRHIQNFLDTGELLESTFAKFAIVQKEGNRQVKRDVSHYGLDVAFYVGYRVNSTQGALFRRWATALLIQFATKGFVIDKIRLEDPLDPGIVDELRDIIADIRASRINAYRKVTDMLTMCQDYKKGRSANDFFSAMENKMIWLAASRTGPQIIMDRADVTKPNMGLTYYAGKRGPVQKDVTTANNYLAEPEVRLKTQATIMLLDYFEQQLDQGHLVTMAKAEKKLNEFIKFNGWPLLTHKGDVNGDDARDHVKRLLKQYKAQLH